MLHQFCLRLISPRSSFHTAFVALAPCSSNLARHPHFAHDPHRTWDQPPGSREENHTDALNLARRLLDWTALHDVR